MTDTKQITFEGRAFSVGKEKDGCWYCYDSEWNRVIECGRWHTEALAIESLRIMEVTYGH